MATPVSLLNSNTTTVVGGVEDWLGASRAATSRFHTAYEYPIGMEGGKGVEPCEERECVSMS